MGRQKKNFREGFGIEVDGLEECLAQLRDVGFRVYEATDDAATGGAMVIADEANRRAPKPDAVEIQKKFTRGRGKVTYRIGVDKDRHYLIFFETGASGHEIDGKDKQALAFMQGGAKLVRGSVRHPGIAARPFLRPAFDSKKETAVDTAGSVWRSAIGKIVAKANRP